MFRWSTNLIIPHHLYTVVQPAIPVIMFIQSHYLITPSLIVYDIVYDWRVNGVVVDVGVGVGVGADAVAGGAHLSKYRTYNYSYCIYG